MKYLLTKLKITKLKITKLKIATLFLLIAIPLLGQNVNKSYDTQLLFGSPNYAGVTETVTYSSTEGRQITVTDADTLETIEFTECGIGNERISVMLDTTSGTTKVYVDLALKVGNFGTSARSYEYTTIDSLDHTNDGVAKQIFINGSDTAVYTSPANSWHLRFRQTGTQVNRLGVNVVRTVEK